MDCIKIIEKPVKNREGEVTCRLNDLFDIYDNYAAVRSDNAYILKNSIRYESHDRTEFTGSSHKNFKNRNYTNLKTFLNARKGSRLSDNFQNEVWVKKRKKIKSSHDGEWLIERQWDTEPFISTKRLPKAINQRQVTVNCDMSFNCNVESAEIVNYGIKVWALCEMLEKSGITVAINLCVTTDYGEKYNLIINYKVLVKDFSDYVDMTSLCHAFHTATYRRGIFALKVATLDLLDKDMPGGLGRAKPPGILSTKIEPITNVSLSTDFDALSRGGHT